MVCRWYVGAFCGWLKKREKRMSHELIQCLAKGNSCLVLQLEGWKQFSCVIAPLRRCSARCCKPFQWDAFHFDHISGEAAISCFRKLLVLMNFLETPVSPSSFFIKSHTITYIIPCSSTVPYFPIASILFVCAPLLIPPLHFWISMP